MTLFEYVSVIAADEVIHIIENDTGIYFGTVRNAYSEIEAKTMKSKNVNSVFSGFGGLCIEVAER